MEGMQKLQQHGCPSTFVVSLLLSAKQLQPAASGSRRRASTMQRGTQQLLQQHDQLSAQCLQLLGGCFLACPSHCKMQQ
jgi:hypothetical protein